jgi:deferrochelatase/peroxidase EfeB
VRAVAALTATAGAGLGTPGVARTLVKHYHAGNAFDRGASHTEPFRGAHQGGIITPPQSHTYLAALDLATEKRDEVIRLLRAWTTAAARMTRGEPAPPTERDAATVLPDSGEAHGLPPARLTLTFGFGAGLFLKDGKDRYGLAAQRPPALVDLPPFDGDQLIETRTGGDLSIQACAEDPQVAFHAVRQLVRVAYGVAIERWAQTGFLSIPDPHQTPRNLMGFKDGTTNPSIHDAGAMEKFVWVGDEGPDWMHGGSYVVLRRIRIALEHWDRMPLEFQEQSSPRGIDVDAKKRSTTSPRITRTRRKAAALR